MNYKSPARLQKLLKRVGPRGSSEFKEIEWDEALDIATAWLARCRATDPRKLAFFTGRDQSQSLTSWWAQQFGTPNFSAHGGFCSVNMAAGGLYTIGSAFWEFGEVSKFEIPYTEQNYLQKEMGYQIARKHAAKLRYYVEGLAFAGPLALVAISVGTGGAIAAFTAGLAMMCVTMGLLIERWLFFAEAKHVVMLYYGAKSA